MSEADWHHVGSHLLGALLEADEPLLLLLNGGGRTRAFVLPERGNGTWEVLLDTAHEGEREAEAGIALAPHSLVLLRRRLAP